MQVAGALPWSRMHADRDLRIDLGDRIHHVPQHDVVGVGPRAAPSLDDDRASRLERAPMMASASLHYVDVEGRHAIIVLRGVVEQLTQRDVEPCVPVLPRWGRQSPIRLVFIVSLKPSTPGRGSLSIIPGTPPPRRSNT